MADGGVSHPVQSKRPPTSVRAFANLRDVCVVDPGTARPVSRNSFLTLPAAIVLASVLGACVNNAHIRGDLSDHGRDLPTRRCTSNAAGTAPLPSFSWPASAARRRNGALPSPRLSRRSLPCLARSPDSHALRLRPPGHAGRRVLQPQRPGAAAHHGGGGHRRPARTLAIRRRERALCDRGPLRRRHGGASVREHLSGRGARDGARRRACRRTAGRDDARAMDHPAHPARGGPHGSPREYPGYRALRC